MQQPLVTVLMPVFNAEAFLKEAVDSILNQTLSNFELLIVEDGSTDTSLSIIQSYNDARIRIIKNESNIGIAASLNVGIQNSSASLIARMDADDVSRPERLQKQYNYMTAHPECVLLSTWAQEMSQEGVPVNIEMFKTEYYYYNMTFENWIYHPTVMYRREAVLAAGGYAQAYSEDYALFCKLLRTGKMHNLNEVLLDYRNTATSLHQVNKKKQYDEAHHQQVIKNIQFFAGEYYNIAPAQLEALKHNFQPLLAKKNIKEIIEVISHLNFITKKILSRPNPNLNEKAIKAAAKHKKNYVITFFARRIKRFDAIKLLIYTRKFRILGFLILTNISRKLINNNSNKR